MKTLTIELTETQYIGLEAVASSPESWATNSVTERARIAVDEIVQTATTRYLDEGIQIPATREEIVSDAFTRGWVKTAAERQAEHAAQVQE